MGMLGMWITEDLKELWREKEILPQWMARFLVIALPVLLIGTIIFSILAISD